MKTTFKILTVEVILVGVVLALFVAWPVSGQDPRFETGRIFPPYITDWGVEEWRRMTDSERWMFIHGMALASWVYGHSITEALNDPATATREEIVSRLTTLEAFLDSNIDDTYDLLQTYYQNGGRMPLWQAPYRVNTLQEGDPR